MSESELVKACLHTTSGDIQPQALACGNERKRACEGLPSHNVRRNVAAS